ncbi:hypothetical protein H1R20_g4679, partial [Candolleomyces eurysporus]
MGFSHPIDEEALMCAKACAIFDLTEKYTQEGEFLAGIPRDDAEAIVSTMVEDLDIETAIRNGNAGFPCSSFEDNSGSPFDKFSAKPAKPTKPAPTKKTRIVISRELLGEWLGAGSQSAETAQEHGTLTEITEEEEAAFLAEMKNNGDDESPTLSLQEWESPDPMLPFIPAELRTSQSAQLVINEPPRDLKGKRRASLEPEEPDHVETCTKKPRSWATQPGEGCSKDGELLTELLAKNAAPEGPEGNGLFWNIARVDAEKAQGQDDAIGDQERLARILKRFCGGAL